MNEQEFQEMMRDWNRELAFTPFPVTCAKCGRRENVGRGGMCNKITTGYVCERCEPTDCTS